MKKVGLVGWRGMVGSVLMQRMVEEGDFAFIDPVYFSTSSVGGKAPTLGGKDGGVLHDAAYNWHGERRRGRADIAGVGVAQPYTHGQCRTV